MYSRSLSALAFTADFPPAAPKFHQRTHRVRLRNLGTTDKKSSRKIKRRKTPRVHKKTAGGNMTLANIYPITASLGLIGYRSYDTSVQWSFPLCLCSLIIIVAISVILVATMKEKENKKTRTKTKKVKPKKGWL